MVSVIWTMWSDTPFMSSMASATPRVDWATRRTASTVEVTSSWSFRASSWMPLPWSATLPRVRAEASVFSVFRVRWVWSSCARAATSSPARATCPVSSPMACMERKM